MLAEQVRHARNTSRIFINRLDGLGRKDRSRSTGTSNSQTLRDIARQFLNGQWLRPAAHGDALAELSQTGIPQFLFEFGLTRKDDLQQFLVGGFEIRKQANFLEDLKGQVLRLVNDQNRGFSVAVALQQPLV